MNLRLPLTILVSLTFAACGGGEAAEEIQGAVANTELPSGHGVPEFQEGDAEPHGTLDSVTLFEIALRHMREGHPDAAVEHLELALDQDSQNPRIFDAYSSALYSLDRMTEALAASERAVSLLEEDPGIRVNRANLYRVFGRDPEALADYAYALHIHPGYAPALFSRGTMQFHAGDNEAALADYDLAIASQPQSANFYFNRAMVQEARGELESAMSDMTRFLELSDNQDYQDLGHTILARWKDPNLVEEQG